MDSFALLICFFCASSLAGFAAGRPATRTCTRSCQHEGTSSAEVFGENSRCFDSFLDEERSYRCFAVECLEELYHIIDANGSAADCPNGTTFQQKNFAGHDSGWVACEPHHVVCGQGGKILASFEEIRRGKVGRTLVQEHGEDRASLLLAAYDNRRFEPHLKAERAVEGEYIIQLADASCLSDLMAEGSVNESLHDEFSNLAMVEVKNVTSAVLHLIVSHKCSAFTEQHVEVYPANSGQNRVYELPPWGIDLIDGVFDSQYGRTFLGRNVDVFVVDTGVDAKHEQLIGRVSSGMDCSKSFRQMREGDVGSTDDQLGHGTHVAGTVAGTQVGVAPLARLVPMKVVDSEGNGAAGYSIRAAEAVLHEKKRRNRVGGGPMLMTISMGAQFHQTWNRAVRAVVEAGVTVVVAAGNDNTDASNVSPSSEPAVITVGASNYLNNPCEYSNYGEVVDIWAPGDWILSSEVGGDNTKLSTRTGTSMAAPHVSGAVAAMLEANPDWGPADVERELFQDCSIDVVFSKDEWKGPNAKILRTFGAVTSSNCDLRCKDTSCLPTTTGTTVTTTRTTTSTLVTSTIAEELLEMSVAHPLRAQVLKIALIATVFTFASLNRLERV